MAAKVVIRIGRRRSRAMARSALICSGIAHHPSLHGPFRTQPTTPTDARKGAFGATRSDGRCNIDRLRFEMRA
jgi:hypothetical protein